MDDVAKIREKTDIVSLISEYIPLKKMGRNFKANCPFHSEKTPSFVVSPERQIWHCFGGCSKGGDCFTFLMEYEKLEFPEALRILAKKAGIELEKFGGYKTETASKKEIIYKLNHKAMEFYHYVLTKHNAGKKALNYLLEKREIKDQVINTFMLGFAPGNGRALSDYLINKKGYKKEDLAEAGLAGYRNGRIIDFFTSRVMFPLFDHRDNVIGFAGRIIDSSVQFSKYVNTRETLVYHKGDVFFGLNIAKERIKKENQAIIMEGEFDVISSFQAGVANVVAVKGTALTENQVNLISRFAQKATLCFDGDSAGQEAIKRSLQALEKKGLTTTVIAIPNAKDPDESIKKDPYLFKKAVKEDIDVYDFLFSKALLSFDKKTAEGKKKIGEELLPLVSQIENEIVKEHYLKKLSRELDVTYETIIKQTQKSGKRDSNTTFLQSQKSKKTRKEMLEEYLLSLILQHENPKIVLDLMLNKSPDYMFDILSFRKILNNLVSFFEKNDNFDSGKFISFLPTELIPSFDACFLSPLPKFEKDESYKNEVLKSAEELRILYLKDKIKELSLKIKEAEKQENLGELETLREEFKTLTSMLQNF